VLVTFLSALPDRAAPSSPSVPVSTPWVNFREPRANVKVRTSSCASQPVGNATVARVRY
jgi:hypothetical protein